MELKDKIKKFVTDFRDGAYQHDTQRDSGLPHDIPEVERLDICLMVQMKSGIL